MSSLYEEDALNKSNNTKLNNNHHLNETNQYQHHLNYNGQTNQTTTNYNQMSIDHRDDKTDSKLTNNLSTNKGHHHPILIKNPINTPSDGNTLIDSDVSNSSNSFASG